MCDLDYEISLAALGFRPMEMAGAALVHSHRGGKWFESNTAHQAFRIANQGCGEAEGRNDAETCEP